MKRSKRNLMIGDEITYPQGYRSVSDPQGVAKILGFKTIDGWLCAILDDGTWIYEGDCTLELYKEEDL